LRQQVSYVVVLWQLRGALAEQLTELETARPAARAMQRAFFTMVTARK
jgi:hypothetical protein